MALKEVEVKAVVEANVKVSLPLLATASNAMRCDATAIDYLVNSNRVARNELLGCFSFPTHFVKWAKWLKVRVDSGIGDGIVKCIEGEFSLLVAKRKNACLD